MILVCGGIKGGSGKTTVATNFAVMRALAGRDVLLVDADDQESATDFTVLRNETTNDQDMVKNNFPTYMSCSILATREVLSQGVEHGGIFRRD